jgi:small subunit ribosomal protein S20
MPNTPSAKKRLRQDAKKRLRNQAAKTRIKTETRKVLTGGDIKTAFSAIDRASAKGIIHRNAAARKKSRLAKRVAAAASSA